MNNLLYSSTIFLLFKLVSFLLGVEIKSMNVEAEERVVSCTILILI